MIDKKFQKDMITASINEKLANIERQKVEIQLMEENKRQLDLLVSDDCERRFTEKRIIELVDQEMKTELKEPMNEEDFDDLRYKIFGIISCALKLESNSR